MLFIYHQIVYGYVLFLLKNSMNMSKKWEQSQALKWKVKVSRLTPNLQC